MKSKVLITLFALFAILTLRQASIIYDLRQLHHYVLNQIEDQKVVKLTPELTKVQGTDWVYAGLACPYSPVNINRSPVLGIDWSSEYTADESENALLFRNKSGAVTYVQISRSKFDACGISQKEKWGK